MSIIYNTIIYFCYNHLRRSSGYELYFTSCRVHAKPWRGVTFGAPYRTQDGLDTVAPTTEYSRCQQLHCW